eukprot:CAMPEP_0119006016 /NCGR_PEP_ID=MMETSP1176-20130426/2067_1 /TAXON_ID=265551 /ORGANISM="Synedropsis recta cf, Strain CCMP1620" /LENGTH=354 /DNA_ID=CAMNT_0006957897 /DNA_START=181 /DNA_END=1245 /DNA_ORIENTATION=+
MNAPDETIQGGSAQQQYFPQFEELHEDLMVNILSYVATVPMEVIHARPRSTVTGVLPLVCKQFDQFCKGDYFWRTALERLKLDDPYLWEEGLLRELPADTKASENLVDQLHQTLQIDFKTIFRRVFLNYIRFTGPVFYMTGHVRIGHAFGLHFFEPRYRVLIAEVMRDWPDEARRGNPIEPDDNGRFPTFIYGHMAPLAPTTPACLVQVRTCSIYADGSADVVLVPVAYVWLERVWERASAGRLCVASCVRMGREQTRHMQGGANTLPGHEGFDSDIMRYLAQNGGLENPSHRAMHAILSYIMNDGTPVEDGDDDDDDDDDDYDFDENEEDDMDDDDLVDDEEEAMQQGGEVDE